MRDAPVEAVMTSLVAIGHRGVEQDERTGAVNNVKFATRHLVAPFDARLEAGAFGERRRFACAVASLVRWLWLVGEGGLELRSEAFRSIIVDARYGP
jgi:hypothetical protein